MIKLTAIRVLPAKGSTLRWEIAGALLIKIVLLVGLWFLIFRWQERPVGKPDMAQHFAFPAIPSGAASNLSSKQFTKESLHDR